MQSYIEPLAASESKRERPRPFSEEKKKIESESFDSPEEKRRELQFAQRFSRFELAQYRLIDAYLSATDSINKMIEISNRGEVYSKHLLLELSSQLVETLQKTLSNSPGGFGYFIRRRNELPLMYSRQSNVAESLSDLCKNLELGKEASLKKQGKLGRKFSDELGDYASRLIEVVHDVPSAFRGPILVSRHRREFFGTTYSLKELVGILQRSMARSGEEMDEDDERWLVANELFGRHFDLAGECHPLFEIAGKSKKRYGVGTRKTDIRGKLKARFLYLIRP